MAQSIAKDLAQQESQSLGDQLLQQTNGHNHPVNLTELRVEQITWYHLTIRHCLLLFMHTLYC